MHPQATASPLARKLPQQDASSARAERLAQVMRWIGGTALVAAAVTFLVQRWGVANDVGRYYGLLGITALIPLVAFACGLVLKEGRSSRTLLGLLLTMVPIHFGVLGGLVVSQVQWGDAAASAPSYALWVASSPQAALLATVVGVGVLLPLSYVAFLALARSRARIMTLAYALGNLAVLLITLGELVDTGLWAGLK